MLVVPLLALILAAILDFRKRQIPDAIPIVVVGWAVATTALGVSHQTWASLGLGFAVGAALGVLLFWIGGIGGGDAKLMAAIGATVGLRGFPAFLFCVAIAGGALALVAVLRGKKEIPYAPAMALALFAFMVLRGWRR